MPRTRPISSKWIREELLHLLSLSGTMAGLSITAIALLHTALSSAARGSIVDDVFIVCALLFLLCTYVIFWALRTPHERLAVRLANVADVAFLAALTGMICGGAMLVYTLW